MPTDRIAAIIAFLSIELLGLSVCFFRVKNIRKDLNFAVTYMNHVITLVNTERHTELWGETYRWITENVDHMQNLLGSKGVISYRPAYANYVINRYPILLNTFPKIANETADQEDIMSAIDAITRYQGQLKRFDDNAWAELKNPIRWFIQGIRTITQLPVLILETFGIISKNTFSSISSSVFYRVVAGSLALVAFGANLATLIIGWSAITQAITFLLGKVFP